MKAKYIFVLISLLLSGFSVSAQDIEKIYKDMPDELNPVLTSMQRFEQLEYYKAGQDSVKNKYGTNSYILALDTANAYVSAMTTQSTYLEMKLFRSGSSYIIGIINTACAPICHSTLDFYNDKWEKVPVKINLPATSDWLDKELLLKEDKKTRERLEELLLIGFVEMHFVADNTTLELKNNTLEFLDAGEKKRVAPFFKDGVISISLPLKNIK